MNNRVAATTAGSNPSHPSPADTDDSHFKRPPYSQTYINAKRRDIKHVLSLRKNRVYSLASALDCDSHSRSYSTTLRSLERAVDQLGIGHERWARDAKFLLPHLFRRTWRDTVNCFAQ